MTEPARWSSPVIGIGISAISARPRTRLLVRIGELLAALAFVLVTRSPHAATHTLAVIATITGGLAWLGWILAGEDRRWALPALAVLGAAGGALTLAQHSGATFVCVAAAATAFSAGVPTAMGALLTSAAGYVIAGLITGTLPADCWALIEVALLGLVLGIARRALLARGQEASLLATAERRAALADEEARLVAERNRLGREIHDVLAHTLGTVSLQLTALDSRLDVDSPEAIRARVRNLHVLVGDGLAEARDAVRALRDDELSLQAQIERLCALHGAALRVDGHARPLRADEALALYRVVQEALTNAAKHAPGAPVTVTIAYEQAAVSVTVDNAPGAGPVPAGPLAGAGGGHGLDGMQARVALAGGRCHAGVHVDGWRVLATFPAAGVQPPGSTHGPM